MSKTRRWVDKLLGRRNAKKDAQVRKVRNRVSELVESAGYSDSTPFEQLEQRQMLFTLQVAPTDPSFVADPNNPGFGTVTATFGYFIPFMTANIPAFQAPGTLVENFDGPLLALGAYLQSPALNANPAGTGLRAFFVGANPFTIVADPTQQGGGGNNTAFALQIALTNGGSGGLSFMNTANPQAPRFMVGATWTSTAGALPAGWQIDLVNIDAAGNPVVVQANVAPTITPGQAGPPATFNYAINSGTPFQRVVFRNTGAASNLVIDSFTGLFPSTRFNAYLNARIFGAQISLYGRAETAPGNNDGTAIQLLDLYGRDMVQTIGLGQGTGSDILNFDLNSDGVPENNDGIGRINIVRGDLRAAYSLVGGTIELAQAGTVYDVTQNFLGSTFGFDRATDENLIPLFRAGGFGMQWNGATQTIEGFPSGISSVIVGSPWMRDNRNPVLYFGGSWQQAPALQGTDNNFGVQLRPDNPNITFAVRVFGAQNRVANNPTGGFVRYAYGNPNGWHGLTQTVLENNLTAIPLPAFPLPLPNPLAPPPPPAPNAPIQITGLGFAAGVAPNLRVWGSFHVEGTVIGQIDWSQASLDRLIVGGDLWANVVVDGDLGTLFVGGHLGGSFNAAGSAAPNDAYFISPMTITIGRRLGQAFVTGRSLRPVTVLGDVNNPNRPSINFMTRPELEVVPAFNNGQDNFRTLRTFFSNNGNLATPGTIFAGGDNGANQGIFRNDTIFGAEWIGMNSAVTVTGTLGAGNPLIAEDPADVFAFAATAGGTITVNVAFAGNQSQDRVYARIVDRNGRTVATHPFPFLSPEYSLPNNNFSPSFNFTPDTSGVYYLVIGTLVDGNNTNTMGYTATVNGMTPVTVGQFNTGGGAIAGTSLTVQSGNVGLISIGNGYVLSDSTRTSRTGVIATVEAANDYLATTGIVLQIAGGVNSMVFAGDLRGSTINIGGNLGTFIVGDFLRNANAGSMLASSLSVGGTISQITIYNTIGFQSAATPQSAGGPAAGPTTIRSGQNGSVGHIGQINVGNFINGQLLNLATSANSIIDSFIVGGGAGAGADGGRFVFGRPNFNLGPGSDIRFLSFRALTQNGPGSQTNEDEFIPIQFNVPLVLLDDSGAEYTLTVGAQGGAGIATGTIVGQLFLLPVDGIFSFGGGAALGRIAITIPNATTQYTLTVTNNSAFGRLSMGLIQLAGGASANLMISGTGEVDIFSVTSTTAMNNIRNATPRGDIVNIDVPSIVNLLIDNGDLGSTEIAAPISGAELAPRRVLQLGAGNAVGGPIGYIGGNIFGSQNIQGVLVPEAWRDTNTISLEDVGSPLSEKMTGLIVRTGNATSISVGNRLGNIVMQGATGTITNLTANPFNRSGDGVYRGIGGVIYAFSIVNVDIGDGVAAAGSSPFAKAGIFVNNDIGRIFGGQRVRNPVIAGVIIAADSDQIRRAGAPAQDGIGMIELYSGQFNGAFVGVSAIDAWWRSARVGGSQGTTIGDPPGARGTIQNIMVHSGSIVRSTFFARNVNQIVVRGVWDASTVDVQGPTGNVPGGQPNLNLGSIGLLQADQFINSTLDGEPREFRFSALRATGSIGRIITYGDINDMVITVGGSLQMIQARSIQRTNMTVAGAVQSIYLTKDLKASELVTGAIQSFYVLGTMANTSLLASGQISSLYAAGDMTNVSITSSGASGGIVYIAAKTFSGSINSSGNIGTIYVTGGDFNGSITTTNLSNAANLNYFYTSRDMNVSLNIAGNVNFVFAGRNVGRRLIDGLTNTASTPDVIDIKGTLGTLQAGGQLYADLIVGQSITGLVYTGYAGPVFASPGSVGSDRVSDATITAFGRINGLYLFGDFAGRVVSHSGGVGFIYVFNGSIRNLGLDGSGNRINSVDVRDGDLGMLYVSGGHLLGNVSVRDGNLNTLYVMGDAVFGNIGIDPNLLLNSAAGVQASQFRNQLPPGTTDPATVNGNGIQDGPMIFAGRDIGYVYATGGIFETGIMAGRNIGTVYSARGFDVNATPNTPTGTTTASFITAGNNIQSIMATKMASGLFVGAGIINLGADNRPGGVGGNADTVRQGNITYASFSAGTNNVVMVAGMNAGADGIYTQGNDDVAAAGISTIGSVSVFGAVSLRAWADSNVGFTTAGVVKGGGNFTGSAYIPAITSDPRVLTAVPGGHVALVANVATPFVTGSGETGTVTFSGTGQAFFEVATMSIVLVGTGAGSSLTINNTGAFTTITGLRIRSLNDASLASLTINSTLQGNSGVFVDGNVSSIRINNVDITTNATFGTGVIGVGGNISSFTTTNFTRGILQTGGSDGTIAGLRGDGELGSVTISGNFGGVTPGNRRIQGLNATTITVGGTSTGGTINIERDLGTLRVTGVVTNSIYRVVGNLQSFSSGAATNLLLTAGGTMGSATFSGAVSDSTIASGLDLGTDLAFGGVGTAADKTRAGNMGAVNVNGNFTRSSVVAGIHRGADGFYGTADDTSTDGRSNIASVTIAGNSVGSAIFNENYRIASTGEVGTVRIGGAVSAAGQGNFKISALKTTATPIQVTNLTVSQVANVYTARIVFNQAIDASSLLGALTIQEIRGTPAAQVALAPLVGGTTFGPGVDYTVAWDATTNTAIITFSQTVTSRNLTNNAQGADPQQNVGSPGVYRFTLASTGVNRLRGATNDARLDGNNDGVMGDNYARADIVGDAGDRLASFTSLTGALNAVSFYPPVNLDNIMNSQAAPSLLPTTNQAFTVRGYMGDHPDTDTTGFQAASDVDLYTVTLQAGQILRLGALSGNARNTNIVILNAATGLPAGGALQALPAALGPAGQDTTERNFLVQTSGTFVIMVTTATGAALAQFFAQSAFVPPPPPNIPVIAQQDIINLGVNPAVQGDYSFTITISNDADSGFRQAAPAGEGPAAPVPLPGAFNAQRTNTVTVAGQIAGTQYVYSYLRGADGLLDTADDRIVATMQMTATGQFLGTVSSRSAGADGVLGTGDDVIELTTSSSDGNDVVVAPLPNDFLNGAPNFNNPNVLPFINVGGYSFRLDPGANGRFDGNGAPGAPSDDVVIGVDAYGHTIERRAGTSGVFSNANGNTNVVTIRSTIGNAGQIGNPNNIQADVDIYHLNNGLPIQPGTRYRITLRASEDGGNFGRLVPQPTVFSSIQGWQVRDLRGLVQFGLFDSTSANTVTNGNLLASPTNVSYFGNGQANSVMGDNGLTRFGYDANGNFFMEFTAAPRIDNAAPNAANPADWARISLYVQGAVRGNYAVDIQQIFNGQAPPTVNTNAVTQNVLINLDGGTINWLEAGGRTTNLSAYNLADNGFTGPFNAVTAREYMTTTNAAINPNSLILQLQAMFNAIAGFNPGGGPLVRFSTNAADFAGQNYSTVFLTSSLEPTAFFNNGRFGAVQRPDMLNANTTDQSVIFMPALNALGNAPTQAGLDTFIRNLTVLVGRQVGQLMGVRITAGDFGAGPNFDTAATNIPDGGPGSVFGFTNGQRALAGQGNVNSGTQFFLGQQTGANLLQRIFYAQ